MLNELHIVDIIRVINPNNSGTGKLCVSMAPGKKDSRHNRDIYRDLSTISKNDIQVIVNLLRWSEMDKLNMKEYIFLAQQKGFIFYHLQIKDRRAPRQEDLQILIPLLIQHLVSGYNILIHCRAGLGRAGTICACCLCYLGYHPILAIDLVRQRRPGAIQTSKQERCIIKYYNIINKVR